MAQNQNPNHWPAKLFDLGSLVVYSLVPWGEKPEILDNFWWKDDRYPTGSGPFSSVQECMEDFKSTLVIRDEGANPESKTSNVIEVDFKKRRRK